MAGVGVWVNSAFTIDDARQRKAAVWDLLINNWGSETQVGYGASFPKVGERGMPTVYGISIGSRSTVDRCIVSYDLQKLLPGNVIYDASRVVSVGAPLIFPQLGRRTAIQLADQTVAPGSLIVQCNNQFEDLDNSGTGYTDTYLTPAGATATMASGQPEVGNLQPFVAPLLHLVFYLKPPASSPLIARAPATAFGDTSVSTASQQVLAFPTYGRKRTYISVRCAAAAMDVTILGIRNSRAALTVGAVSIATAAAVVANTTRSFVIDPADYDYTIVLADPGAIARSVFYTLKTVD